MSSFIALNIEPDDDSDDEVENIKEIQIEEALKLYQNALKLHSQGPKSYGEAAEAYAALFESEIFKYPESLIESANLEFNGYLAGSENHNYDDLSVDPAVVLNGIDGAPKTLPQILYLSFKNRGQFILDSLRHELAQARSVTWAQGMEIGVSEKATETSASAALAYFTEALERDETDLELWRRTSRISELLGSKRISRYCLESILDDDDPAFEGLRPPTLEEGFAGEGLKTLLDNLSDELSISQPPVSFLKHKGLSNNLKKHMDPYPYLPESSVSTSYHRVLGESGPCGPTRHYLKVNKSTWVDVGNAILQEAAAAEQGLSSYDLGVGIIITLSDAEAEQISVVNVPGTSADAENHAKLEAAAAHNENMSDDHVNNGPSEQSLAGNDPNVDPTVIPVHAENVGGVVDSTKDGGVTALSPRKRSSTSAGMDEYTDTGRVRSKRIRARESILDNNLTEAVIATEAARQNEEQLQVFSRADHWMFHVVHSSLHKLGIQTLGRADDLKQVILETEDAFRGDEYSVGRDLYDLLHTWNDEKVDVYLREANYSIHTAHTNQVGLTPLLEHFKLRSRRGSSHSSSSGDEGLADFARSINGQWLHVKEVAYRWLENLLLAPQNQFGGSSARVSRDNRSSYLQHLWSDALKEVIVQMLVKMDADVYSELMKIILQQGDQVLTSYLDEKISTQVTNQTSAYAEMVQTIFELHVDIYASITNPSSEVDQATRTTQKNRLDRWATLASEFFNLQPRCIENLVPMDDLSLRHVWTSVYHATMSEDVSRDYILFCFSELKELLRSANNPVIKLLNNAVMPEISAEAADEEIFRLSCKDLLFSIFSAEYNDVVAVIENLEPLLNPQTEASDSNLSPRVGSIEIDVDGKQQTQTPGEFPRNTYISTKPVGDHPMQEMTKCLEKCNVSLRLILWRKLCEAYQEIDYRPMVFSCCLRAIDVVMHEFKTKAYLDSSKQHRQMALTKWLVVLDDLLTRSLTHALSEPTIFECIDSGHLVASMTSLAELSRFLHFFALYEDSARLGHVQPAAGAGSSIMAYFRNICDRLRNMQMRAWTLQYVLLKEATLQNSELFISPAEDLTEYLRWVHYGMGIRGYCKASNMVFIKMMKNELLSLTKAETWEIDMAQILYDLYGLKLFSNMADLQDHNCPPESIDRKRAIKIMDFVMGQIKSISVKDLPKTEFKPTLDKLQQVLGAIRPKPAMLLNRRILNAYLSSTINPLHLYRCLQGVGYLSTVPVRANSSVVASKGWYLLQGHMALARFRSQKRVSPGPTDDLDIAATFLRQDLEHSADRWETWYRLAQVYDCKIEEGVLWSAEKLNNDRRDLVDLQRFSIHCYMMAIATAVRTADSSYETARTTANIYLDFGMRIYASSRPPFDMEVFETGDFRKHHSGLHGEGMYTDRPHKELSKYSAWKFARILFKQALVQGAGNWMNHYMLGKCLWKMHCHELENGASVDPRYQQDIPVNVDGIEIIDAFLQAIETIPNKRDNRHDPLLEPHYKLVSIVHKLVRRKELTPEGGSNILKNTPYAQKTIPSTDDDTWEPYILSILKSLRVADKANWHHRMIARAAHVIYDDSANDITAAMGAKHEFTQQIFTKTLTLQVWKPEHERAGRHYVYTSQYVTFFIQILSQLNDRASLEALLKRVRRRPNDFYRHNSVWQYICVSYLELLRRAGQIPSGHEDTIFRNISHEDFGVYSKRLEDWCHHPTTASPTLDILHDAIELRKLNNNLNDNLMKNTPIDDLIVETYAKLYEMIVPEIVQKMNGEESRERMSLTNLLMSTDGATDGQSPQAPQPTADPTAKQRVKGVGRRELQRKAEAAVTKPTPLPVTTKSSSTAETVAISQQQTIPAVVLGIRGEIVKDEAQGVSSSVPNSIHDSADDESELSEVEEQRIVKPMFPNLVGKDTTGSEGKVGSSVNP